MRIYAFVGLALMGLVILSCSGGYKRGTYGEVFENGRWTYSGGFSGDWKCEISANGEWYGTFSGGYGQDTGLRDLRGDGNAVVYLPDRAEARVATVGQKSDNGTISIRIVGLNHTGELVTGTGATEITTLQEE